jgi:hypothetical protein
MARLLARIYRRSKRDARRIEPESRRAREMEGEMGR